MHKSDPTRLRLLSRAVEQSPTSVVITNLNGEIEYVNPKFTEVTGFTYAEAVGQNPRILKSGLTPPTLYRELWDTILAGKEWRGEILNRKKNGETYWEFASISGVMNADGMVTHFVAVKEDITQRKEIERHLRHSEERFRNIFENSPVAYLAFDQSGCLRNVNANLCQLLGADREVLIGRSFGSFWAPGAHIRFEDFFAILNEQHGFQTDLPLLRVDGVEIIVSLESRLQIDLNDGSVRAHCTLFNITERQQMQARLQRQNDSLSTLHQGALEFLQYHDLNALFRSLVKQAMRLLDSPFGAMLTVDGEDLVVRASTPNLHVHTGQHISGAEAALGWQAIDTREPAVLNASTADGHGAFQPVIVSSAALPIFSGSNCLGVLMIGRDLLNQPYDAEQLQIGRLFAQIAALAIENAQLHNHLMDQSIRDPLTGLFNRRYLFETLQREFATATREAYPISIVLLDIDRFKHINDQHGHGAGDIALRALATRLQSMVRASDILCRYGGDEHIIVMPKANAAKALERAEKMCRAVSDMRIPYQDRLLSATISMGVAAFPLHGSSIDEVTAHADKALYFAKNAGRNQVILYHPEDHP